ncbi:MAG: HU family DNA-binding protein [Bradymonadales bacterium]|nr:HU family DNA-binding protein [Bradymonadales bacterium]
MTKAELIDAVKAAGPDKMTKKDTAAIVEAVFDTLRGAITKDGRFSYPGFGTFTVKHRKARDGRNPRTGAPIQIPESKTVSFKPAPAFREAL